MNSPRPWGPDTVTPRVNALAFHVKPYSGLVYLLDLPPHPEATTPPKRHDRAPRLRNPVADFQSFAWRLAYSVAGATTASPRVRNSV